MTLKELRTPHCLKLTTNFYKVVKKNVKTSPTFNLLHGLDTGEGVGVAADAGPVLGVLLQTLTVQHALHRDHEWNGQ